MSAYEIPTTVAQRPYQPSAHSATRSSSATTSTRPSSASPGTRPSSASPGSRPSSATTGTRPSSATTGTRPSSSTPGTRPGPATVGGSSPKSSSQPGGTKPAPAHTSAKVAPGKQPLKPSVSTLPNPSSSGKSQTKPQEHQANNPKQDTTNKPKKEPKEKPKKEPKEKPKKEPKEKPKKEPKEKPIEEPTVKQKKGPMETPKDEYEKTPKEVTQEKPKKQPKEKPKKEPKEKPKKEPKEKPIEEPTVKQKKGPMETPKDEYEKTPKEVTQEKPKKQPKEKPGKKPKKEPTKQLNEESKEQQKEEYSEKPKKEPKAKKQKKPKEDAEGRKKEEEETPNFEVQAGPSRGLSLQDIIFISVVWTTEMVYNGYDMIMSRFTADYLTANDSGSRITELKDLPNVSAIVVITVFAMVGTGAFIQFIDLFHLHKSIVFFKYWILIVLLAAYSFTGPFGIILTATKSTTLGTIMSWLPIAWNVLSPIRFRYIFHQVFPISVRWTHLLVSGNILAIGIVEYILAINVEGANRDTPFSQSFYYSAFAIMTLASVGWLLGLYYVKRYQQQVHEDLTSVREKYMNTEVIEKFNRRQTLFGIIIFVAVILPGVTIPVMNEFVKLGRTTMADIAIVLDVNLIGWRPDLLVSLTVVVAVEVALQFMRKKRNELSDLVLIGISHIINILVVLMFMAMVSSSVHTRKIMGGTKSANLLLFFGFRGFIDVDVGSTVKNMPIASSGMLLIEDVPDNGTVLLVMRLNGKRIIEQHISLVVKRCRLEKKKYYVNAYMVRRLNGSYQLSRASFSYVDINTMDPMIVSIAETCTNYRHDIAESLDLLPNVTIGILSETGKCLPVSWRIHLYPMDGVIPNATVSPPFKPPAYDSFYRPSLKILCGPVYDRFTFHCHSVQVVLHRLDEYFKQVYPDEYATIADPRTAYTIHTAPGLLPFTQLKFYHHSGLGTYDMPRMGVLNVWFPEAISETRLLAVLSVYGLSLGIAWVGYIHFFWIQSPIRLRILIIFIFFTMMCLASSVSKNFMTEFNEENTILVLVFSMVTSLWQIGTSIIFSVRWFILHRQDQLQEPWHRF